jgi:hypothetical protein
MPPAITPLKALERISQYVSWCNHGEMDRGEALQKIDEIASKALRDAEENHA